jgi:ubiquinone biosynthesis protein
VAHISVHDLPRVREVARILARHGFGEVARLVGVDPGPDVKDIPLPRRFRMALAELGPTFIKLGQVLSVRHDILPPHVIAELAHLQDAAPRVPFDAIRAQVERELGGTLEQLFTRFDVEPVASASIAQVHFACLQDGREVAVKVQRPGIEPVLVSDLHILTTLARLLEGQGGLGAWTPVQVVQEFEQALMQELDFLQEAAASERFRQNHAATSGVRAPAIHREVCSRRVLVMERVTGRKLATLEGGSELAQHVMRRLIESWYLQLFEHGFFHGDPHPGNLLVEEDGTVVFLDFGLTGTLTGEMQETLTTVFTGLAFKDAEAVARCMYRAGATSERVDRSAFRSEIARMMAKYEGASLGRLGERGSLTDFVDLATRYRIRLPREYAILARATSIVDGIGKFLLPDADIVAEVRPYAQRLVQRRLSPETLGVEAMRTLQLLHAASRDLPAQADQLLMDLERGRITLTARDPDAEAARLELRHAATRIRGTLGAAGWLVAASILLVSWDPQVFGMRAVAAAGACAMVFTVVSFAMLAVHGVFGRSTRAAWGDRVLALVRFFASPSPPRGDEHR